MIILYAIYMHIYMQHTCTLAGTYTYTYTLIHNTHLRCDVASICIYLVVINQVNKELITHFIMLSLAFYLFALPVFYLDVQMWIHI